MGIPNLLRFLKPFIEPVHIKKYAGKRVNRSPSHLSFCSFSYIFHPSWFLDILLCICRSALMPTPGSTKEVRFYCIVAAMYS